MSRIEQTTAVGILDRIVESKRLRVEQTRRDTPMARLRELAEDAPPAISLAAAISSAPGIAVISEMKRMAPSAGELDPDMDPALRAGEYCSAGAAAISVLTEFDHFRGTIEDLAAAKTVAVRSSVPVLLKDFVFDEYQVWEARAAGADAVLLIVSILDAPLYSDLFGLCQSTGMDVLVEVFDESELEIALSANPGIVGVNNRNLRTLETSLDLFERVAPGIGNDRIRIAESGMKNAADVRRMGRAGADAVLVGESLMRAGGDAASLVRTMSQAGAT